MNKLNIVFKGLKVTCVGVLLAFLVACSSSNKIVQTYDGLVLPKEQIAILTAPENISIISVNGKEVPSYLLNNIETNYGLKAGLNHVVFKYESVWAKPGPRTGDAPRSEKTESKPMLMSFDAKTGGVYSFSYQNASNIREARLLAENFSAFLVDGANSKLVESSVYGGALPADHGKSLVQQVVDGLQTEKQEASVESNSSLSELKLLWGKATPKERKAFLAWAFKE